MVHLKLSTIIDRLLERKLVPKWDSKNDGANRYEKLQFAGNQLRGEYRPDFLSEIAIAAISSMRVQRAAKAGTSPPDVTSIVPGRVAYFVDQLKHPDEVTLLREVYGNLFYLIGVLTGEKQRRSNLEGKLDPAEISSVMLRDRQDEDDFGQQLDKTLKLSDFFLRNNNHNTEAIDAPLRRFFSLVHGQTSRTPTKAEFAMYAAFSTGLKSACLSRQVGASITDKGGNVISTGCNDVPKAQGGLYSEDDGQQDHRCIKLQGGNCFNDQYKGELAEEIKGILKSDGVKDEIVTKIMLKVRRESRLRDLIEFSRSVHAEMDAIVSITRRGGPSIAGGSLYSTTFPCHSCARHIVAAGIVKVLYIEPYEKSLALDLHSDAIISDVEDDASTKVQFLHFEGVAPRQYQELFFAKGERKKNGKAIPYNSRHASKLRVQYLDGYRDLESKVLKFLIDTGFTEMQIAEISSPAALTD